MSYEQDLSEARKQDHLAHMRERTSNDPIHKMNLLPMDEAAMEWALLEIERLRKSVLNQSADNLCWVEDPEQVKMIPRDQFLESCARYHTQMSAERGVIPGCMTIAQLEAEVERLRGELEESRKVSVAFMAKDLDSSSVARAEVERLLVAYHKYAPCKCRAGPDGIFDAYGRCDRCKALERP